MNERLYIKEIQQELQYRDRRSVRRWCRNNGVRILCDIGSNRWFVLKDEFEIAKSKNYHFNKDSFCSTQLLMSNHNLITERVKEYKPQGKYEKIFFNCLQNYCL